ncbi:MAG: 16S rRNA (uracil(1498)-N(3))-methyltransferase [Actinomycetota bacterium]|nr:16S rRNA (uracil(1498)-N(3))-methyltransferase [Actinomycetota bacterium]
MSLPQFFAGAPEPGEPVVLSPEDARHAIRSLRLRPGDEFSSADGVGGVARCRIVRADRLLVEAEVVDRHAEPRPSPRLTVLLAPPKGERLTWAVQKLTELGADEIVLLETPRSVRRWQGERAERIAVRLDHIAREAAKQARRPFLPVLGGPVPWIEAVTPAGGPLVVLWERADRPLLERLPARAPDGITLVVGPEGGIAEDDARSAEAAGARLASLGPNVLRTETAAIAAAAVTLAHYGRLG